MSLVSIVAISIIIFIEVYCVIERICTCGCCGTSIFLKRLEDIFVANKQGTGYILSENYEDIPKKWGVKNSKDLCPECLGKGDLQ